MDPQEIVMDLKQFAQQLRGFVIEGQQLALAAQGVEGIPAGLAEVIAIGANAFAEAQKILTDVADV